MIGFIVFFVFCLILTLNDWGVFSCRSEQQQSLTKSDRYIEIYPPDESEAKKILKQILDRFIQEELNHYYFVFDDCFDNHDLSEYYNTYPILDSNDSIGCFEIKSEDVNDTVFIYKLLNQYHYSDLYINTDPDFLRFYNPKKRVQYFPQDVGYIINMENYDGSYICIKKPSDSTYFDFNTKEEMTLKEFYQIYLPALKEAFENDNAIDIPDPEMYIKDEKQCIEISLYVDKTVGNTFLDEVGYYLDARTHNFPDAGDNLPIDKAKDRIIEQMYEIAEYYNIDLH